MSLRNYSIFNPYLIIAIFIIVFESLFILKGHWSGDFFEHSAVVNELSKDLVHPNHPIIKSDLPHAFFSPYSVLVAAFSKLTGFGAINSLGFFAFINLILFLYSFYYFCKCAFKENYKLIASIALVLTMVFWGKNPFDWSGFFHIFTLHYVTPYPSTFAISLTLLALGLVSRYLESKSLLHFVGVIFLSATVLITHPTTVITLYVGIVFICLIFKQSMLDRFSKCFVLIVPSILLALCWPYYSILDLFVGNNFDFHSDSLKLYSDILLKNWPILFIIPILYQCYNDKRVKFLGGCTIVLLLIYLAGFLSGIYGVSRVISTAMLFSHFLMAYYIAKLSNDSLRLREKIYLTSLMASIVISLGLNFKKLKRIVVEAFDKKDIEYYDKFAFLEASVQQNDVIFSDSDSNWIIPTFNGKVIASGHPLYWVNDIEERRNSVTSFFKKQNSDSLRQTIIDKYSPKYILIDHSRVELEFSTFEWLNEIGSTVYKKNNLELIELKERN